MAKKKPPKEYGKPPVLSDLTTRQRTGLNKEMNRIGQEMVPAAEESRQKYVEASQNPANTADYRKKSKSRAGAMERTIPTLENRPITLAGAAQRRTSLVETGVQEARTKTATTGQPQALRGAGWYYEHSREILSGSQGIDPHRALAASAVLSPGKDPKAEEIPAAHGVMGLHANDPVIHQQTKQGVVSRRVSEMSSQEVADAASLASREHSNGIKAARKGKPVPEPTVWGDTPESHIDLMKAGLGHNPNIAKSVSVVRGEVAPEDAVKGPKVQAYHQDIKHAYEQPETELDYMNLAHHLVHGDPNQGMLIYSDPRQTTSKRSTMGRSPETATPRPTTYGSESMLSPEHVTAEDTWMQAISSNQALVHRGEKGRAFSPAKRVVDKGGPAEFNARIRQEAVGTAGDTGIDQAGLAYAWQNEATSRAAREMRLSHSQHGEMLHMPSIMMQEVPWTVGRQIAAADAPYNAQAREYTEHSKQAEQQAKATEAERVAMQPELFPEHTGGRNRIGR